MRETPLAIGVSQCDKQDYVGFTIVGVGAALNTWLTRTSARNMILGLRNQIGSIRSQVDEHKVIA